MRVLVTLICPTPRDRNVPVAVTGVVGNVAAATRRPTTLTSKLFSRRSWDQLSIKQIDRYQLSFLKCQLSNSTLSAEVRIIGVIGGFFLTLVLLFVCFLRVRCMAKRSQARRRTLRQQMGFGGNSRNQASGEGSTVFSLNVSQSGMAQFMIALSNLRRGSSGDNTLGEVIVQPPPYSEHDPITPPVPEYTESPTIPAPEVFLGPPPPYSYPKDGDAVVMGTQSAGGESSGGGTREDDNGTGPELENRQ
ncbi:hypothetical protein BaRGS_00022187 [Batillaria attramentaria]|uniref:Uncharacterized protein n=1 Tax=Batillaria attramentaria TaxID=370345 RepID=A0ABD0KH72_9CAEN